MALRKGAAPATDNAVSRGRRVNDKQQRQPSSLNSQTRQISRPISSIHIGKRHRKDMGEIDALARSMADLGLLQPIVIRPDDRLIAGHRRLAADCHCGKPGEFGYRDANNLASGDGQRRQRRGRNWTSAGAGVCGDRFRCTPYG